MAGVVNIRRDVDDKFYRYKMPRILSKIEGKGNGIKTVVPNMSDIAKSLSRPPAFPTKYFGIELGAQVKCDDKNDRYVINGAHEAERLAVILDGFIAKFVLCPSCKNPETDLKIEKDERIMRDCKACGAHLPVEMSHKLCTYIIKNPGESAKKKSKKKGASDSAANPNGESRGDSPNNNEDGGEEGEEGSGDDDELTLRIQQEAAALKVSSTADIDEDWGVDTSEAAVAARMKELSVTGAIAKLVGGDGGDDEDGEGDGDDDPLEFFSDFLVEPRTDAEIKEKMKELGVRSDKALTALCTALFNENIIAEKQIVAQSKFFSTLCKNEKCQKALLGGIEKLVGVQCPSLMPRVPLILKALYDEELVEEETMLAWSDKPNKKYVDRKVAKEIRAKAAPFIAWLREADSDDEDSEEE